MDADCLKADFVKKLSDKVDAEVVRLDQCARDHWEDVASCLGLGALEQPKLYSVMEDQAYVWRSMYVDHLQKWIKVYPPESMLIVPSDSLKEANSFKAVMERFAALLGLPRAGPEVHNELIFKASPASADGNVHENGRSYIGEIPPDVRDAYAHAWPYLNLVLPSRRRSARSLHFVQTFVPSSMRPASELRAVHAIRHR